MRSISTVSRSLPSATSTCAISVLSAPEITSIRFINNIDQLLLNLCVSRGLHRHIDVLSPWRSAAAFRNVDRLAWKMTRNTCPSPFTPSVTFGTVVSACEMWWLSLIFLLSCSKARSDMNECKLAMIHEDSTMVAVTEKMNEKERDSWQRTRHM